MDINSTTYSTFARLANEDTEVRVAFSEITCMFRVIAKTHDDGISVETTEDYFYSRSNAMAHAFKRLEACFRVG